MNIKVAAFTVSEKSINICKLKSNLQFVRVDNEASIFSSGGIIILKDTSSASVAFFASLSSYKYNVGKILLS